MCRAVCAFTKRQASSYTYHQLDAKLLTVEFVAELRERGDVCLANLT